MPKRVKAIHLVYAKWCPHCVPTVIEPARAMAMELNVPCRLYDIDTEDEKLADELVRKYGDWSEDYVIPQLFFEFEDGEIAHVLTGKREGVEYTKRSVMELMRSDFYNSLKRLHGSR
ncbi:MAG: hypothetical protein NZ920_03890 [Aigarchaeota archaeon]|nr:hypothetical protein [Aigarchaeota archaeon]MDW8092238.1 hypothetical protein [Nitrososphaerota archaeon]